MPHYTQKAQVPLTEEQYRDLLLIAAQEHKRLGALLREAAERVYLEPLRARAKAAAVSSLLSLPEIDVPEDYQVWEKQYLDERASHG